MLHNAKLCSVMDNCLHCSFKSTVIEFAVHIKRCSEVMPRQRRSGKDKPLPAQNNKEVVDQRIRYLNEFTGVSHGHGEGQCIRTCMNKRLGASQRLKALIVNSDNRDYFQK